jgi:hypothetical protein
VEKLVHLVRTGSSSTKKDALAALLSLAGERENVGKLVDMGDAAQHGVGTGERDGGAGAPVPAAGRAR